MKYDFYISGTKTNTDFSKFVKFLDLVNDTQLWYYKGLIVEIDPTVDFNNKNVLVRWVDIHEGFNDRIIMYSLDEFQNNFTKID